MPNNAQNIQPPSFDDFTGTTYKGDAGTYAPPLEDVLLETYEGAGGDSVSSAYSVPLSIINHTDGLWFPVFSASLAISAIVFTIILYALFRVVQIRLAEREKSKSEPRSPEAELLLGHKNEPGTPTGNESVSKQQWAQIEMHMQSQNPNDWRLAILEADIMLDDLITSMGYIGEGLGEKLKQVRPEDLNSIEAAWEAHKVRNKVAHEGAAHELSEREVRRVINLYKQVFTEAKFI